MTAIDQMSPSTDPWWKQLTRYHWLVLLLASATWYFDCLDQRMFSLARIPALTTLMNLPSTNSTVQADGKIVTAIFLIGWAIGGMIFGSLGDKFGRTKMLTVSVLTYSLCTSLSFFSRGVWDFTIYRGITGLGIGGVFGMAVALIAETVPASARPQALGLLQIVSSFGNVSSAFVKLGVDKLEAYGVFASGQGWRFLFLIGAIPAIFTALAVSRLREPQPWLDLKANGLLPKGSFFVPYARLLEQKQWRKNLLIGSLLASTGVVGLWGIGEYAPDLQRAVFTNYYAQRVTDQASVKPMVNSAINNIYIAGQCGAAIGMLILARIALRSGRKVAFACGFSFSLVLTFIMYWKLNSPVHAYWMIPLMYGAQFGLFALFSIYLPELFPSAMRGTGVSFCYNVGRFAAAAGSFGSSAMAQRLYGHFPAPQPARYAAMTMCAIYLVGLLTLPFAPETRGKPLP